ncbi:MAG: hypothetical protein R2734_18780 [Nocardioides sp.]
MAGVSEALATTLGLVDQAPLVGPVGSAGGGTGRVGTVGRTTLRDFAVGVAAALPRDGDRRTGGGRPRSAGASGGGPRRRR